jgi:hypothetical protein
MSPILHTILPYDSVHDLHTKGYPLGHQLQLLVNTFQEKYVETLIYNHLVPEIVHGIVWRFVRKIGCANGSLIEKVKIRVNRLAFFPAKDAF